MSAVEIGWLAVGFGGQGLFMSRFLVQWIVSERKQESVIPVAFWYLSIVGGLMLLAYAIHRVDPVIITGQLFGVVVYARNLVLIHRSQLVSATSSSSSKDPETTENEPGPLDGNDQGNAALPLRNVA